MKLAAGGYQPQPQQPMTRPPPHGQPQLLFCCGEVTICALPLVWHCVVFGAVVTHRGCAAATGANATAAPTQAAAKSGAKERILVRMVGLLVGHENLGLAAAVAAAAATTTDDQRRTMELVIPRIHISWFGRGGVDLDVAGGGAFGS